jgi:hypothetical protein
MVGQLQVQGLAVKTTTKQKPSSLAWRPNAPCKLTFRPSERLYALPFYPARSAGSLNLSTFQAAFGQARQPGRDRGTVEPTRRRIDVFPVAAELPVRWVATCGLNRVRGFDQNSLGDPLDHYPDRLVLTPTVSGQLFRQISRLSKSSLICLPEDQAVERGLCVEGMRTPLLRNAPSLKSLRLYWLFAGQCALLSGDRSKAMRHGDPLVRSGRRTLAPKVLIRSLTHRPFAASG